MSFLLIAFLLGLLLLIHELGHFLAARWMGIPVARFSIGLGPKLWGFRRGETEFWLAAIPFGGYVLPAVDDEHEYFRIPVGRRIILALGGPAANFLLPLPLFAMLNVMAGDVSLYHILIAPWVQTVATIGQLLAAIPLLFSQPDAITGVVGIVVEGERFVGLSLEKGLFFSILMSLNLGVFNLLPIPALDGGKILLHLAETLHPRSARRLYVPLSLFGWLVIIGLVLYVTVMDIGRYVV